jgi:hypothetical protein
MKWINQNGMKKILLKAENISKIYNFKENEKD